MQPAVRLEAGAAQGAVRRGAARRSDQDRQRAQTHEQQMHGDDGEASEGVGIGHLAETVGAGEDAVGVQVGGPLPGLGVNGLLKPGPVGIDGPVPLRPQGPPWSIRPASWLSYMAILLVPRYDDESARARSQTTVTSATPFRQIQWSEAHSRCSKAVLSSRVALRPSTLPAGAPCAPWCA